MNKSLCDVRKREEITEEEMAERIGISAEELRRMEQGEIAVTDAVAQKIQAEFYVSADWLQGVPLPDPLQSPEEREMIKFAHRMLTDPGLYPLKHVMTVLSKMDPDELQAFLRNFEKISMYIGY